VKSVIRERLRNNYSTIYVTIVSVMLALVLEDLVSIMRGIDDPTLFHWLTAGFVVHVIFNAWVGYSAAASIMRHVPTVWDSLNVFVLTLAHFALNSSIGETPVVFFYTASGYSAIGGLVTYYNVWRAAQDDAIDFQPTAFHSVIGINLFGAIAFFMAGALTQLGALTNTVQVVITVLGLPFATVWLVAHLRSWKDYVLKPRQDTGKSAELPEPD